MRSKSLLKLKKSLKTKTYIGIIIACDIIW